MPDIFDNEENSADVRVDDIIEAAKEIREAAAEEEQPKPKVKLNIPEAVKNIKDLKLKNGQLNFEDMTEEVAYDLDIPIIAKPFSNEDMLKVELKDKNYVPRWVNVNPIRLGAMRARGFIYVVPEDLATPLNIEIQVDAQGHYICNDVVLMRITKERYYSALRAAHLRAMAAVNAAGAHKAAVSTANQFMEKAAGGEYVDYANNGKVRFYQTTGG